MKKLLLITLGLVWFNALFAVQLSGTYTIDATQPATATNFRNFNSALVFMNSDLPRPDGGPSNVAPFGVSGPVTFNVVASSGPYHEQIRIRYVVGSSAINTITFEGNNNVITDTCNATVRGLVVLDSADHIRIRNFIIRPMLDAVNTGWGVHFTNRADSNLIENCTIDIGLITSTSSVNSAGIVMSGSLNSPTTTVECLRNTIQNNTIRGGATNSGMYYGIILSLASGLNITNNRIINNTIEDFFYAGIQLSSTNRTIVRGNTIRRPLKTSSTTAFGIFGQNITRFDSISYNRITDLFSGMPTNTNQVTAIYLINYSATATEPTTILNNFIRINNGDGNQFGINLLSSSNLRIYNNTIVLDNASSTSATAQTSGISSNVTTSASSILDLRNNIISITRGGTGPKWAINTSGNWAIGSTIGKNGYFSNAQNYNMASYLGINYPTYNAYRTFLATVDQTSVDFNPLFVNSSTGNFSPQDAWYDGNGDAIPGLTVDINGTTRTLPLDVGAFEATPQLLDVAMNDIVLPVAPYVAGAQNISVRLRNGGTTAITSAIINWTVNGAPQTPVNFTGSLAGGSISAPILLGSITTVSGTLFNITATVSQPNGGTDPIASNNSASGTTASTLPGGTYTLNNGLPASATNFTSIQTFAELISIGGISGPVVLNAAQGSGPYVGQVAFRRVLGASITNTVTFNGNGVVVQANPTTSETYVILLNGTDYARLNNFTVRTLNPSNSIGLLFTGRADSNIVDNVTIDFSNVNTNSLNAGIAFTASLSNPSATSGAHNGIFNLIQNNRIIGNPSGGLFISISHMGGSSEYTTIPSNNRFINNELVDVYATGFVSQFSSRNIIRNNLIYQSAFRTAFTTFTGINVSNGWLGDTIDNNRIYNAFINNLTTTLTCTGIVLSSAYSQTTAPGVVRNNLIYGFAGIGTTNGISLSFTTSVLVHHNTVFFNNPSASATSIMTGINISTFNTTHNLSVRNNIVSVVRGGTGFKIGVLVGANVTTSPTTFVVNNNAYFVGGGTNAIVGRFTTLDFPTLALWRTANASAYDQNAVYANPNFRNQFNPNLLLPNNDTLNNVGANLLTTVPTDVTGVNRTATPDPGAYEFTPSGNDAGLTRFTSPLSPISLGSNNVDVMLRNFGNNALTSTAIDWTVDGISQGTTNWAGSLNSGDSVSTSIGSFNFVNTGFYEFKAWTSAPNNTTDDFRINDTITTTYCTPVSGTITINPAVAASVTNYHTFNALINVLRTCGIAGNVIVNVAAGTYNEQVNITGISGLNNGNRIIFNGADSATTRLVFSSSNNAARYTLQLYGADNITFNNIRFEANGLSLGTAVQILADGTNRSDSVTFKRCTFFVPQVNSTSINAFAVSSSATSAITGTFQAVTDLTIDSCTAIGGYYGISIVGPTAGARNTRISITNSLLKDAILYATFFNGNEFMTFNNNVMENIGRTFNQTTSYAYYQTNPGLGIIVNANTIRGMLGGYGIWLTTTIGGVGANRHIISNNMIQLGEASNTGYGIYCSNVGNTAIVNNSVNITTASSTASCLWLTTTSAITYNTVEVLNNIFVNRLQGYVIWLNDGGGSVTPNLLNPVNWEVDHNVYFGLSTFPYRSNNFISAALPNYINATAINNDSFSVVLDPNFVSSTNLRQNSIGLNNIGRPNPWATTDIDGVVRGALPDPGVNEYNPPADDAGVLSILSPSAPVTPGLLDVAVIVKNFGSAPLTTVDVTYTNGTVTQTQTYTGNIPSNGQDTVRFTSTSGAGATSQQFNYTGGNLLFTAYTTNPNTNPDASRGNDTLRVSLCQALSGVYTINLLGTGATNFTSFTAAVSALNCGGVASPVIFNVATGTYTEQINLGIIPGASALNTIVFRSATLNKNDVVLTFAPTTAANNFVVNFAGTQHVHFNRMTVNNTNISFGRVFSFGLGGVVNSGNISVTHCTVNGPTVTTISDAQSNFFSPSGSNIQNVTISNNEINNGSYSMFFGGQGIINQFSSGLVIDSNQMNNFYYYGPFLTNRANTKIRRNTIISNLSAAFSGIYFSQASNETEIANNRIQLINGYPVYLSGFNMYGEPSPGRIYNNSVVTTTNGSSGIYAITASNLRIYNNSINLVTTSTTTTLGGIYIGGTITSVPQVAASQIQCYNNAINSGTLPSLVLANAAAISGTTNLNHNVYFGTGTNLLNYNNTLYTAANFTNSRNTVHLGSDVSSFNANPSFTSSTNLLPDASAIGSWVLNGRAIQEFGLNRDINGGNRSEQISTGAPDIGAFEFTPSALPPAATVTGTIGYGEVQHFISFGDTIGTITWGFGGLLPTSITARFAPGTLISNRASSPNSNALQDTSAHLMDAYWSISANGGSSYLYDIRLRYKTFQMGNVPSESDIKLANRLVNNTFSWWNANSFTTILDTVNNIFGMNGLLDFTSFTGTTDIATPLPVRLNEIRASRVKEHAQIIWSTASEKNTAYFMVERKLPGQSFEALGKVRANGNSSVIQHYRYMDNGVASLANGEVVYYRLRMVDFDGSFKYSPTVAVSFDKSANQTGIEAYPNPFSTVLNVSINVNQDEQVTLVLYDMMGKVVRTLTETFNTAAPIIELQQMNSLPAGVYYLKVISQAGEQVTKLIKE